jgi:hypothetical protein
MTKMKVVKHWRHDGNKLGKEGIDESAGANNKNKPTC